MTQGGSIYIICNDTIFFIISLILFYFYNDKHDLLRLDNIGFILCASHNEPC